MEFVFLPLNRKGGYSAFPPSLELNGAKGRGRGEGRRSWAEASLRRARAGPVMGA